MNLRIELQPKARKEFDEAYDYYFDISETLGEDFLQAVRETIFRVSRSPKMHQIVFETVRRAVVERPFPYCVYYREHPEHVEIISVFHTSRNPMIWKKRV